MKKSAAVIAASFLFVSFCFLRLYLTGFGSSCVVATDYKHLSNPNASLSCVTNKGEKNGVVIVTMVSYERLDVFKGFDDFYQKMWDNRVTYAEAHGKLPLCMANFRILVYACRREQV
jgi:hypothetical protein